MYMRQLIATLRQPPRYLTDLLTYVVTYLLTYLLTYSRTYLRTYLLAYLASTTASCRHVLVRADGLKDTGDEKVEGQRGPEDLQSKRSGWPGSRVQGPGSRVQSPDGQVLAVAGSDPATRSMRLHGMVGW